MSLTVVYMTLKHYKKGASCLIIFFKMKTELRHFELFADLADEELEHLEPYFFARTYKKGASILSQGEKAVCLYLLTVGRVELIYKPYDGEPLRLTTLGSGNAFGWSAVLGNPVYGSSVVALENSEVLAICGDDLATFKTRYPKTGARVLERLANSVAQRRPLAGKQVSHMLRHVRPGRLPEEWKGDTLMANTVESPKVEQIKVLLGNLSAYIEQFHGGSVEFVSLDGETLVVRLGGACMGCPLSPSTLHGWVEGTVRQFFPEIKKVEPAP